MRRRGARGRGLALAGAGALLLGLAPATATATVTAANLDDPRPAGDAPPPDAPPAPAAAPAPGAPARASLTVDTSAIGAQSPVLLRRIEELGDITLRRAEILPGRAADDPVIAIRVRPLDEGGYAIESSLLIAGEVVANSEHAVLCTLCTEGETVDRARVEVERLVPFVRSRAEARAQGEATREAPPPSPPTSPPARRGLSRRAQAGVGLIVVGGASLGVGIGLAARPARPIPEMPLEVVDTRPPGYVLAGVGGALVITGVGLLLAGRGGATGRRIHLAPTLRGLVLSGRF